MSQPLTQGLRQDRGVLYAGRAQEKATVWRTQRRYHPDGSSYAWPMTSALASLLDPRDIAVPELAGGRR